MNVNSERLGAEKRFEIKGECSRLTSFTIAMRSLQFFIKKASIDDVWEMLGILQRRILSQVTEIFNSHETTIHWIAKSTQTSQVHMTSLRNAPASDQAQ